MHPDPMPPTLAPSTCPRPGLPADPANWRIAITERIPAPSYIRIGDELYSENVSCPLLSLLLHSAPTGPGPAC